MPTVEISPGEKRGPEYDLDHVEGGKIDETALKYDKHGMLLIPQPTDRPDDPLVRSGPYR